MAVNLEELDRITRRMRALVEVKRLNKLRDELHQELVLSASHDRLKFYCEVFQAERPSYTLYWQAELPERWPWGAKLREQRVVAYAWMARSAVDTHIKRFTIFDDGLILCEAGYFIPLNPLHFVAMILHRDATSQPVFDRCARKVFGIEEPKPGYPPEPLPHRPWEDCSLEEITQIFMRDVVGIDPAHIVEPTRS